ncbi:sodium/glucose cotransporter 4, partial [Aplysia californica]|uniref:Sodium/glucose cotransporter 4 n=1 Tax=Aplysia californica TaxID=6500 RepID=A0ABM1ADY9_APLCA
LENLTFWTFRKRDVPEVVYEVNSNTESRTDPEVAETSLNGDAPVTPQDFSASYCCPLCRIPPVHVFKLFVIVLVGVSIAWIPLIKQSQEGQLFMYIQAVTGYIAPPISAIFLLAIFVPRINEKGAFWGVICGQATGIIRLVLDFIYPSPGCGEEDTRPSVVSGVHFTYFSIIVFMVTVIIAVGVSLLTKPQARMELENLTFWTFRKRDVPEVVYEVNSNTESRTDPEVAETALNGDAPVTPQDFSEWRQALRRFRDTSASIGKDSRDKAPYSPQEYIDAYKEPEHDWRSDNIIITPPKIPALQKLKTIALKVINFLS